MARELKFSPKLFNYLKDLKANNNKEWFDANKDRYFDEARDPFLAFIAAFRPRLQNISSWLVADPKPAGGSMLRIYRDLRFSKSKEPYKTMVAAYFHHANSKDNAPGIYLHLEPGECFLGLGLWQPDTITRRKVTDAIYNDPQKWEKVSRNKPFKTRIQIAGSSLSRIPKQYDDDHPFADDLKRKDFIGVSYYSQKQVCSVDFIDIVEADCKASAAYLGFLTEAVGLPW